MVMNLHRPAYPLDFQLQNLFGFHLVVSSSRIKRYPSEVAVINVRRYNGALSMFAVISAPEHYEGIKFLMNKPFFFGIHLRYQVCLLSTFL